MDSLEVKKIQAINKYKRQRLLNKLMFYSSTTLTFILFLSIPLWYPLLRASFKILLFDFLPKIGALLFSSKSIFIVGNLIIIFLVGESKISKSKSSSLPSDVKELNHAEQENQLCTNDQDKDHQKNFIFLNGESKISISRNTSLLPQEEGLQEYYYEGEVQRSFNLEHLKDGMGNEEEKFKGDEEFKFVSEPNELNKRADDFIARVNKQIRLEAVTVV